MPKLTINLPALLYAELQEVSAATGEPGYSPAHWAGDLVASELAARRLPRVTAGRNGARIEASVPAPVVHRLVLPEVGAE